MSKIFNVSDLVNKSHTVLTKTGEIWVNMTDGTFVLRETVKPNQKAKKCTSVKLYSHVKRVMSRGELIAERDKKTDMLMMLENPKKIKYLI